MVNPNFIALALNAPDWVEDEIAIAIAKSLSRKGWEIDRVLEITKKYAIFRLERRDRARLSSEWVLWLKKPSSPFMPVRWGVGRRDER